MSKTNFSTRLNSLDALRGFDMLWIIGADDFFHELARVTKIPFFTIISNQLDHASWNGFTAYDMIFPLFLFIAGVATPYSVAGALEKGISKNKLFKKILKRALLLVLLGFIYNNGLVIAPLDKYRFPSVLGRIGIAYLFANIIYLYSRKAFWLVWFVGLLIGYWLLLHFTSAPGFAAGDLSMQGNFASYVDRLILPGSLYLKIHDPEGILSTIPAISTGLLGIMVGEFLRNSLLSPYKKAFYMVIVGIALIVIAQLWNIVFPINKNLWSSSFTLQAGGISLLLLSAFYFVIDVLGYKKWALFFRVIGLNTILIYMSGVFINWNFTSNALLGWLSQLAGKPFDIAISIACIIFVKWIFLFALYKKKYFLRV